MPVEGSHTTMLNSQTGWKSYGGTADGHALARTKCRCLVVREIVAQHAVRFIPIRFLRALLNSGHHNGLRRETEADTVRHSIIGLLVEKRIGRSRSCG